jgi:hypothetical protein
VTRRSTRLRLRVGELSRGQVLALVAGALLLLTLVLRYLLIERTNVNWDEFNFLRVVHDQARGEQTRLFQTAHGHLFAWLAGLPVHELDQVIVGRYVMFLLAAMSAVLLGWLGMRLIGGGAGLFAASVYGAFAYVLVHGTAFRFDSLIVPCYLGAAAALVATTRPCLTAAVAAALASLALVISIKTLFFLPPLVVVVALPLLQPDRRAATLRRLLVFAGVGILATAAFYLAHRLSLAEVAGSATAAVGGAAEKTIDLDNPLPQANYLIESLRWDTLLWLLLLLGLVFVGGDLVHRRDDAEGQVQRLRVLALAAPIATLYFYRNSFPYYYVSVLPGACLLAGAVWRRVETLAARPVIVAGIAFLCAFPVARHAARWYASNNEDATEIQEQVILAVHGIFDEPVTYIDRCGMLASFDKAGPFMSSWGMESYRRAGVDMMPELLRERQPKFVLANSPALELQLPYQHIPPGYRWRPEDYRLLQENFVHHWGPIWVAGKVLRQSGDVPIGFEILIPGRYTVEAAGLVDLDGVTVEPGQVIDLGQGEHSVRALEPWAEVVILRWGERLLRPDTIIPNAPIFVGFGLNPPP